MLVPGDEPIEPLAERDHVRVCQRLTVLSGLDKLPPELFDQSDVRGEFDSLSQLDVHFRSDSDFGGI